MLQTQKFSAKMLLLTFQIASPSLKMMNLSTFVYIKFYTLKLRRSKVYKFTNKKKKNRKFFLRQLLVFQFKPYIIINSRSTPHLNSLPSRPWPLKLYPWVNLGYAVWCSFIQGVIAICRALNHHRTATPVPFSYLRSLPSCRYS